MKKLLLLSAVVTIILLCRCGNSGPKTPEVPVPPANTNSKIDTPIIAPTRKQLLEQKMNQLGQENIENLDSAMAMDILSEVIDLLDAIAEESGWKEVEMDYEKLVTTLRQSGRGKTALTNKESEIQPLMLKIQKGHIEEQEATANLKMLGASNRWEKIRKSFSNKLNRGAVKGYKADQENIFKQVLEDWELYKEMHKVPVYRAKTDDLEELFFMFSKDNALAKAAWGFILQEMDWDAAATYYSQFPHDPPATGQPYFFLKYYYYKTGHRETADALYDDKTNESVDIICREH